jgi:hypothetical protein
MRIWIKGDGARPGSDEPLLPFGIVTGPRNTVGYRLGFESGASNPDFVAWSRAGSLDCTSLNPIAGSSETQRAWAGVSLGI